MEFDKLKGLWTYYKRGGSYEVIYRLSAYNYLPKPFLYLSTKEVLALGAINHQSLRRPLLGYEFAVVGREAIDEIVACQGDRLLTSPVVFERFFAEGRRCYVVRKQGQVVAYFWTFQGSYTLDFPEVRRRLTLLLDDNQVFFGNGFIAPAYRLKGLFPYMLKFVTEQHSAGMHFFSAVDGLNRDSQKAHNRFGFISAFHVTCLGLLNARLFYRSEGASRFAVFLGAGRPELSLSHCLAPPTTAVLSA